MTNTTDHLRYARPRAGSLAIVVSLLLAAACSQSKPAAGSAKLRAFSSALLAQQVQQVTVTLTASDLTTTSFNLTNGATGWSGILTGIKPGSGRNFHADAYDGSTPAKKLFIGDALGVTIASGVTSVVQIQLEQVTPPPPLNASEPVIDSLLASSDDVALGAPVSLSATAHDSDPALSGSMTYAWTASAGSFSPTNALNTTWTAPASATVATLTLTVTDAHNNSASLSVNIVVEVSPGAAVVNVTFDEAPVISSLVPSPLLLVPGQPTTLTVTASDPIGKGLTYLWTSTCTDGNFSGVTGNPVTFTEPASTANQTCSISVKVSNALAASDTGTILLSVQAPATPQEVPQIDYAFQSTSNIVAGSNITLQVFAHSQQSHPLTFSWTTTGGTLGTSTDTASGSSNTWFLPCAGHPDTATVTVHDGVGGTFAAVAFNITEACTVGSFDAANFDSNLFAN